MLTVDQQIEEIQKEIRKTPYHKGTERHIGILKAKIAKLKAKKEAAASRGSSGRGISYAVKKQGDATIVLVGPPSAGKSTLLNELTNAKSKVAPYAFTTLSVIPGIMVYKDARIQLLDVPGLIEGAEEGKGRGREVLSVVRGADLVVLLADAGREKVFKGIEDALYRNGVRINQKPPEVVIEKKLSGGVIVHSNIKQEIDKETIRDIAHELSIKNADISIKEKLDMERLIDAFSRNRIYIPGIHVVNKIDEAKTQKEDFLYISAKENINLDKLKELIWQKLNLVRIFLVKADENPKEENPLIVKSHTTLKEVAQKIGEDFSESKTKAKIWGSGAKFSGQEVSLTKKVVDGMMVRFL